MAGPPRSELRLRIEALGKGEWIDSFKPSNHDNQDAVGHLCRKVAKTQGGEFITHRDKDTITVWVGRVS